jgi:hypothetical protein
MHGLKMNYRCRIYLEPRVIRGHWIGKKRITEMNTKIARLLSLASLLWGQVNSLVYSEKTRGQDYLQHHITAACVADK